MAKKNVSAVEKQTSSGDAKLDEKENLSITNTIIKFLLDQSIGAIYNTAFFIAVINLLRGATYAQTAEALSRVSSSFPPCQRRLCLV